MSLCSHVNSIYTKLAQLDRRIQTHCLYPHPQSDVVQINAPEYFSDIDGQTELLSDIQPSASSHTARTEEASSHAGTLKKIQPQSPPIPENTPHFYRILTGLNLSPNQFWKVHQDTEQPREEYPNNYRSQLEIFQN